MRVSGGWWKGGLSSEDDREGIVVKEEAKAGRGRMKGAAVRKGEKGRKEGGTRVEKEENNAVY